MFLWIPSGSMECPEGVLWFSKDVLMSESCMSREIMLMQPGTLVFVCDVDVDVSSKEG